MADIFGLDTLVAQMVLALGAALLIGNGSALVMARRGVRPKGSEGNVRRGRVMFLMLVGALMAWWGLGSLLTS